jgi:hypothetical protein
MSGGSFGWFGEGLRVSGRVKVLAIVNMVLALLNFSKVAWVLGFFGYRIGFMFSFPNPIPTTWDLASVPTTPSTGGQDLLLGLVVTALTSFVIFFYLKRLAQTGLGIASGASPQRIFDILVYQFLLSALGFAFVASGPLFLLFFVPFIIFYYFTFPAPFLVVFKDMTLPRAIAASVRIAKSGRYLAFVVTYVVATLLISIPLTLIVTNAQIVGLLTGIVFGGGAGLWLTCSTSLMVRGLAFEPPPIAPAAPQPAEKSADGINP